MKNILCGMALAVLVLTGAKANAEDLTANLDGNLATAYNSYCATQNVKEILIAIRNRQFQSAQRITTIKHSLAALEKQLQHIINPHASGITIKMTANEARTTAMEAQVDYGWLVTLSGLPLPRGQELNDLARVNYALASQNASKMNNDVIASIGRLEWGMQFLKPNTLKADELAAFNSLKQDAAEMVKYFSLIPAEAYKLVEKTK